ncbi:hypothetical protein BDFB_010648 [Asbolus verrucosus]|uniref:Uncharacterized protein n=1 Tax=Asbolus verrucosus TaxID=1661398 RepID=A0A482VJM4_ASBVE|nr:hypothetical protein BDFB_010648 [Asbolus verrucosus]
MPLVVLIARMLPFSHRKTLI